MAVVCCCIYQLRRSNSGGSSSSSSSSSSRSSSSSISVCLSMCWFVYFHVSFLCSCYVPLLCSKPLKVTATSYVTLAFVSLKNELVDFTGWLGKKVFSMGCVEGVIEWSVGVSGCMEFKLCQVRVRDGQGRGKWVSPQEKRGDVKIGVAFKGQSILLSITCPGIATGFV